MNWRSVATQHQGSVLESFFQQLPSYFCHILVIIALFQTFKSLFYWWSVIDDLGSYYCDCFCLFCTFKLRYAHCVLGIYIYIYASLNWLELKQTQGDSGGQVCLECYSLGGHRVGHDLVTEQQQDFDLDIMLLHTQETTL